MTIRKRRADRGMVGAIIYTYGKGERMRRRARATIFNDGTVNISTVDGLRITLSELLDVAGYVERSRGASKLVSSGSAPKKKPTSNRARLARATHK